MQTTIDRSNPTVYQVTNETVDAPFGSQAGSIAVVYGESDAEILEAFDAAVETGDAAAFEKTAARAQAVADGRETQDADGSGATLTYHGESVIDGLSVHPELSYGIAHTTYNGGELDETAFEIVGGDDERGELAYRVVVFPPALDDAERQATQRLPSDADEGMVFVENPAETEVCGSFWGAALVGVMVVSLADDSAAKSLALDADEVELETDDGELGASVGELLAARV